MQVLHLLVIIMLGLIFGSFGSVIFFRLGDFPTRSTLKGFLFGRSECRHCHHILHTSDLIPLRSFFSQQGKCRHCKAKLSRRYPTLELGTVAIFLGTYLMTGTLSSFFLLALGLWLLFIILLYDLKAYELHLTASFLLLLLSFFGQWGMGYPLLPALTGMLIFFLVFLMIYYGARRYVGWRFKQKAEGFGFGDVLLAGILGSMFPVFIQISSALEWGYLVCGYLVMSCFIGILRYGIERALLSFFPSIAPPSSPQATIEIAASGKVLPFLPAMSIAFVLVALYGQHFLTILLHF